ncbi:PTS mannitol transporter subunit IIA [[Enterobacter] lignolyticus]|uniref:PTS IIA-like nitrogen-regulatory protein PtsN n=1 Tax=Enterobacter lignolyticus (strain SCF1) TaxID=701347 RepID=E3G480_ENTLS|nr:PTS mannitol transporter subunit IIA [[Enterobacter] lignolyticus]ADO47095.1 putative PTS IIA-like nitrogen-regulatory protein PtsN [[Enterobacter] lignolyticus SCF1]
MRLIDYFPESSISIHKSVADWQSAVDLCMAPLLNHHYINHQYISAIKESTLNNGPYYILVPGVAMPHTRPEYGAMKTGMTLTLLKEGVFFAEGGEPVTLLIGLSAADSDSHIGAIQALSELLSEEEQLNLLLTAHNEKQLADIIAHA